MNLTPEEKRHTLRAISNAIDSYAAAIDRTPRNCDTNLPILDTEEKLREYLNKIAGFEVNPLTIQAHIYPDHVHLDTNHDPGMHIALAQSSPRWFQVQSFGIVDRAVLPVLKELHARHDREIQEAAQKRWEESCEREAERNYTGSLEQMAKKANMTPDRFMEVKRSLEEKLKHPVQPEPPSILTRILNLLK